MMLRRALLVFVAAVSFGVGVTAGPGVADACDGHKGDRFKKADANGDGFVTANEVSEKLWLRWSVADANNDNKVSRAEFVQAKKDGKFAKKDNAKA